MSKEHGNSFYKTTEWFKTRSQIVKRDGYKCVWCDADVRGKRKARVDHIKELSSHPELAYVHSNLRTLCNSCDARRHRDKGRAALKARGVKLQTPETLPVNMEGFPEDPNSEFYKR